MLFSIVGTVCHRWLFLSFFPQIFGRGLSKWAGLTLSLEVWRPNTFGFFCASVTIVCVAAAKLYICSVGCVCMCMKKIPVTVVAWCDMSPVLTFPITMYSDT